MFPNDDHTDVSNGEVQILATLDTATAVPPYPREKCGEDECTTNTRRTLMRKDDMRNHRHRHYHRNESSKAPERRCVEVDVVTNPRLRSGWTGDH